MLAEFLKALGLAKGALDVLKGAKDLLPDSPEKKAATLSLEQADRAIRVAEAQVADELGYLLCRCTWPPQIALRKPDGSERCPACGRNVSDDLRPRGGGSY